MKAHKDHTKEFGELTFKEQSSSLSASFANLGKAIHNHMKLAKREKRDVEVVWEKSRKQVLALMERIDKLGPR